MPSLRDDNSTQFTEGKPNPGKRATGSNREAETKTDAQQGNVITFRLYDGWTCHAQRGDNTGKTPSLLPSQANNTIKRARKRSTTYNPPRTNSLEVEKSNTSRFSRKRDDRPLDDATGNITVYKAKPRTGTPDTGFLDEPPANFFQHRAAQHGQ